MVVVGEFVGEKLERERGEMKYFGLDRMKTEQKFDLYKTLNLGANLSHPMTLLGATKSHPKTCVSTFGCEKSHPMIFVKRRGKFGRGKILTFGCDFAHPKGPIGAKSRTQ